MTEPAFLTADGDHFIPDPVGRSFWSPTAVHGRVAIALMAQEIERRHGAPELIPARLVVDLYATIPQAPLGVTTRVVRESGRLRLIDAEVMADGRGVARATCLLLKRTEAPSGVVWKPDPWAAAPPDTLPPEPRAHRLWETRWAAGQRGGPAPKQLWMREIRELTAGVALSPFVRVAAACDFSSPFTHVGSEGLKYINADMAIYLHREPVGEWIGFEATNHEASDGVAIGEARLHDVQGPIGFAPYCALANRLPPRPS